MHSAPCPHEVHTTQWRHEDKNRFNAMDGGVVQRCKTARHMQSLDSFMHLLFKEHDTGIEDKMLYVTCWAEILLQDHLYISS